MFPPIVRTRRRHSEKVHGAEADHFQLVLTKSVLQDGVWRKRNIDKSATSIMLVCVVTNDICKLHRKSLKHARQVEYGRLRQPLVHSPVDLPVALDEARCTGRKARRNAHLPSVEHHLSAVVARVPLAEWRRRSN